MSQSDEVAELVVCCASQMHPVELARQVTLLEFDLFRQIQASELVGLAWMKADKQRRAPNLLKMIDLTNRVRLLPSPPPPPLPACIVLLLLLAVLLLARAEPHRPREPRGARRRLLPRVRPARHVLPPAQLLRHRQRRQRARVLRRLPARALLRHGLQGVHHANIAWSSLGACQLPVLCARCYVQVAERLSRRAAAEREAPGRHRAVQGARAGALQARGRQTLAPEPALRPIPRCARAFSSSSLRPVLLLLLTLPLILRTSGRGR